MYNTCFNKDNCRLLLAVCSSPPHPGESCCMPIYLRLHICLSSQQTLTLYDIMTQRWIQMLISVLSFRLSSCTPCTCGHSFTRDSESGLQRCWSRRKGLKHVFTDEVRRVLDLASAWYAPPARAARVSRWPAGAAAVQPRLLSTLSPR